MSVQMFQKKADRLRTLAIGGALTLGGVLFFVYAGTFGAVVAAAGVLVLVAGILRGRRALVTLDATNLLLRFAAPLEVPLRTIVRLDQLKSHDIELGLASGAKVLIPMSRLEEDEGAWLKKSLRKTLRDARIPRTF